MIDLSRQSLAACCSRLTPARAAEPSGDEFFEAKVRPLLVSRCGECHGANGKAKGGLRLTSREDVLKGGDSGPAAVPGKPEESAIVAAIRYVEEPKMPPKGKLPDAEIATLTAWVERGMPWPSAKAEAVPVAAKSAWRITDEQRRHWSYQPLRDPAPPKVSDASWPRSDLDRFVLAGLERKGLRPAPPADRRTLIRRATFDLIGLPPSPEQVEAFVNDRSPDAFAKVVDRLIASPRYGERWGRHWLDLVRYADSRDARGVGGADDIGEAWRYRDWVVAAFNRDEPYDRFVIDQVAGDLSPGPGPEGFNADGMVATGLLTIGEWGTGDADKEKMMTDIVADQVDVVGRAFLGLTIACARCHDHKFDPIPTADYYGLAGFFFSTHIIHDCPARRPPARRCSGPRSSRQSTIARGRVVQGTAGLAIEGGAEGDPATAARAFAKAQLPRTADYLRAAADYAATGSASLDEVALGWGVEPAALRRWLETLGLSGDGATLDRPVQSVGGLSGFDAWTGPSDPPWVGVNRTDAPIALGTLTLPPRSVDLHPGPAEPAAVAWSSPVAGPVTVSGRVADADPNGGNGVTWAVEHRRGRAGGPLASGAPGQRRQGRWIFRRSPSRSPRVSAFRPRRRAQGEYSFDTTTIDLTIIAVGLDVEPDNRPRARHPPRRQSPRRSRGTARRLAVRPAQSPGREPTHGRGAPRGLARRARLGRRPPPRRRDVGRRAASLPGSKLADALTSPGGPFYPTVAELPEAARARLAVRQAEIDALRASPPAPIPVGLSASRTRRAACR